MRAGVLTISDRAHAGVYEDRSGPVIAKRLAAMGATVVSQIIVPDSAPRIKAALVSLADDLSLDVIITTGGTGLSPRDVTPEATAAVLDREVPGIPVALVTAGLAKTPHAMLSRGVAGIRKGTLIVNLPGSPKAVTEGMDLLVTVLGHAADMMAGRDTHSA